MNWGRAKAILILCFLLGNVILGWQYIGDMRGPHAPADPEQEELLQAIQQQLAQVGLELAVDIPMTVPRLQSLRVHAERPDPEVFRPLLTASDNLRQIVVGGQKSGYYLPEAEAFVVGGHGVVRYWRLTESQFASEPPGDCLTIGEAFVRSVHPPDDTWRFDHQDVNEAGDCVIHYLQYHEGRPIFAASQTLWIDGDGVRDYRRVSVRVVDESGNARTVQTPVQLLQVNLPRIVALVQDAELVDLVLGYYLPRLIYETVTLDPAWRLRFSDGTLIIINAFTGSIEWPS